MYRHLILGLITLSVLVSIPFSATRAQDQDNNITLVILGDSLTAGFGIEKEKAYPSLLEEQARREKLPLKVVNAGISGDTSAGGARRVNWAMKGKVDIFMLALGANDGLRGLKPSQTKANLIKIVRLVRERFPAIKLFLAPMEMPPNMGEEYRAEFRKIYKEVGSEERVELLPFILEGVAGDHTLMLPDAMHPNEKGHEKIAVLLWPYFKAALGR